MAIGPAGAPAYRAKPLAPADPLQTARSPGCPPFGPHCVEQQQASPELASTTPSPSMQIEHRIRVAAAPQAIFRIYEDVANWHTWDPDTRRATLDGPFEVGSRGRLTPTNGNSVPIVLTEVVRHTSFTVESRIPFFRMLFEHELLPMQGQTEVVHRVTFSGPLTLVLGKMLARRVDAGLPVTLARLRELAESLGAA
jgi:hypothetical protein